jgi:hypothetical protein
MVRVGVASAQISGPRCSDCVSYVRDFCRADEAPLHDPAADITRAALCDPESTSLYRSDLGG